MVAQLKFNSVPMREIAGIDTYQLRWIYGRERDETGKLVRAGKDGLPEWAKTDSRGMRVVENPTSFGRMYGQVARSRGWTRERTVASWQEWLKANPQFAIKGNC